MRSGPKKVFLVVTIPTHLRVLMDVADLLRSSGQYEPVLIYYPSAVFEQNAGGCQTDPHDAWVYIGGRFVSKLDCLSGVGQSSFAQDSTISGLSKAPMTAPRSSVMLTKRLTVVGFPNRGLYRWAAKKIPCIHPAVASVIRMVYSTIARITGFVAAVYGILQAACYALLQSKCSTTSIRINSEAFKNRTWLQRALLHVFEIKWDSLSSNGTEESIGLRSLLIRRFTEGLFPGLGEQKSFFQAFDELVAAELPSLVLLPEENLFYNSQLIVRTAHSYAIPVVVVPFTIVNTLEWAEAFFDVDRYQANQGLNRLLAKAFPHWVLEHRGRRLILPSTHILGCEYFDMAPRNPWLINSGNADAIAAESQFMLDYYERAGIQKEKIHLIGALYDDQLHSILQRRNERKKDLGLLLGIQVEERLVLVGLPPNQFGAGRRKGCEFDNYEELVRFMIQSVVAHRDSKTTVLINLHPRIDPAAVKWLERLGAVIVPEPIETLVPLSDVYIAVASATIRLGIACGIPVLNYDAYQYNYDDFKCLPGVCEARSRDEYERTVDALLNNSSFYSKIKAAQQRTADDQCSLDGKAGKRMLALFSRMVAITKLYPTNKGQTLAQSEELRCA